MIDPQDPNTLYAGATTPPPVPSGGFFKSTDGGANWSAFGDGLPNAAPQVLAIDPRNQSTLYAAVGNGAFKSTDGGASWRVTGLSADRYFAILSLAIDPQKANTLYAAISDFRTSKDSVSGIFKSTDGE